MLLISLCISIQENYPSDLLSRQQPLFLEEQPFLWNDLPHSVLHSCISNDSYSFPASSCSAPGYPLPILLAELGESSVFHLSELFLNLQSFIFRDPNWEKLGAFSILIAKESVNLKLPIACLLLYGRKWTDKEKQIHQRVCVY